MKSVACRNLPDTKDAPLPSLQTPTSEAPDELEIESSDMWWERRNEICQIVHQFSESDEQTKDFPKTCSKADRRFIHKLAEELGFSHESTGHGAERKIQVGKGSEHVHSANEPLNGCDGEDQVHATICIMIRNAKNNFKYKRRKSKKPRLNAEDLGVIQHMLQGTNVTHAYDPETNDLCFDTHIEGDQHVVIDGNDTGGQIIRTAMSLAIKYAGGRFAPLSDLEIQNGAKGCMLYVQAAMHTLRVGDSFRIRGGDPTNSDAPTPAYFQQIFAALRAIIGLSYCLTDLSDSDGAHFVLSREEDTAPDADWEQGDGNLSIYLLDQILMALVFWAPPRSRVKLRGDYDKDYHVPAMIKMLQLVGHTVNDAVEKPNRFITVTSGTQSTP